MPYQSSVDSSLEVGVQQLLKCFSNIPSELNKLQKISFIRRKLKNLDLEDESLEDSIENLEKHFGLQNLSEVLQVNIDGDIDSHQKLDLKILRILSEIKEDTPLKSTLEVKNDSELEGYEDSTKEVRHAKREPVIRKRVSNWEDTFRLPSCHRYAYLNDDLVAADLQELEKAESLGINPEEPDIELLSNGWQINKRANGEELRDLRVLKLASRRALGLEIFHPDEFGIGSPSESLEDLFNQDKEDDVLDL